MMEKPIYVDVFQPKLGGKVFLVEEKGMFVLDTGPCLLRVIALTHAGSGGVLVVDGVPDDNGFFPDENMPKTHPNYFRRNGKVVFKSHPVVMGSFALDAGMMHGLTVVALGGRELVNVVCTFVWMSLAKKAV